MAHKIEKLEIELRLLQAKKESFFCVVQNTYDMSRVGDEERFLAKAQFCHEIKPMFIDSVTRIIEIQLLLNKEVTPNFSEIEAFLELYGIIKLREKNLATVASSTGQGPKIKLPSIDLVGFNGEQSKWPLFYEMFRTLIHENNSISDTQKVQYLISKLSGRALSVVSGVQATAANYNMLWHALIAKYEDKRTLANTYLEQIFSFKALQAESALELDRFIDTFCSSVDALNNLRLEDLHDYLLFFIAQSKLDQDTRRAFEVTVESNKIPKFRDLVLFIKNQAKVLERTYSAKKQVTKPSSNSSSVKVKSTSSLLVKEEQCHACNEAHGLFSCDSFKKMTPNARYNLVKDKRLCLNCLSANHKIAECKAGNCQKCQKRHNTMLHFENEQKREAVSDRSKNVLVSVAEAAPDSSPEETCVNSNESVLLCSSHNALSQKVVLLSTVRVNVRDHAGQYHSVRFVLDSGSQSNLITEATCKKLGLSYTRPSVTSVIGVGSSASHVKGQVSFIFSSRFDNRVKFNIGALVVKNVVDQLPSQKICVDDLTNLMGLQMADNTFMVPGPVHGILGAQLFSELLLSGKISGSDNSLIALQTKVGFVVMGQVPVLTESCPVALCIFDEFRLDESLRRFFALEEVPVVNPIEPDDLICEQLTADMISRDQETGRYTVGLPFKFSPGELGDSLAIAKRRFLCLEKKLENSKNLRSSYNAIMQDYLDQGHMERAEGPPVSDGYFIPHHAVFKPDSITTKVRVVFDASAKSTSGKSLNDLLFTGPTLYADLFDILINFRLFPIVITADIRQMYRQINMCSEHWKFQKILWRFSAADPIESYILKTVAFGVKSSPYLALRILRQLADDESEFFPGAADLVKNNFYMDDFIVSIETESEAVNLFQRTVELFKRGGFQLTKWSSNSVEVNQHIPVDLSLQQMVDLDTSQLTQKVLGLVWQSSSDNLGFSLDLKREICTKRNILSTVARIFDPLGFLAPVVVSFKLLIKRLWLLHIDWDAAVPDDVQESWNSLLDQLGVLSQFSLPRHIGFGSNFEFSLVGFSDASELAYGGVVYGRSTCANGVVVRLLCAKSKVSPVKSISIPRLELCAAHLLAKLVDRVSRNYSSRLNISSISCFTDSTVVLSWIKGCPSRWKTFVANRVSKIQDIVPKENWYHIAGKLNPADCLSRGLLPNQLLTHTLWFDGPVWLASERDQWPVAFVVDEPSEIPDSKTLAVIVDSSQEHIFFRLATRISSWRVLLRTIVIVCRFCKLIKVQKYITVADLKFAERRLLKVVQQQYFGTEIAAIKKGQVPKSMLKWSTFIDSDNLLRVGGRLKNSNLDYDAKHPILLPAKSKITELLIDSVHKNNLHTGPHIVLSILRQQYWILNGRNAVRQRVRMCNICFKTRPKARFPVMADLPAARVTVVSKPFTHTGVDYAGPVSIVFGHRRGNKALRKAYICLFICLTTKAIHLELASDLTTECFLAALRRFLARRGDCRRMYSDCGTNFLGAKNKLNELYKFLLSPNFEKTWVHELSHCHIEWNFNPPSAPHFGGIWEANIKSVKAHLYRVVGTQILSYEEFITVLVQIEAVLNSRPLCAMGSDATDPAALTPAHFLTLGPLHHFPEADVSQENRLNRLDRYQLVSRMVQHFWQRWSHEYLGELMSREKWQKNTNTQPNIRVGTVVVVLKENTPPLHWPLAVVTRLYPGKDGVIRVAALRTAGGELVRPLVKLCPLPTQ